MKRIIAAGVERLRRFDTPEEADRYIEGLKRKNSLYKIIFRKTEEGKIKLRIREQYHGNPLIGGTEDDICAKA